MKQRIKKMVDDLKDLHMRRSFHLRDKWMEIELCLPQLTSKEIEEINRVWPFVKASQKDLIWHRVYKKEHGFDPFFVADYQFLYILRQTNPYKQVASLGNKSMLDVYYPKISFPMSFIKSIRGVKWCEGKIISNEDAVRYLLERNINKFVIKPSVDTGCGTGVKVVDLQNVAEKREYLKILINGYGKDFVIQEFLKQHESISRLNPTSINSCRVTTVLINGHFHHSTVLKIGKIGSTLDNWRCGYFVGVDRKGNIFRTGYDSKLVAVNCTDNGIRFGENTLPLYDYMIESLKEWHSYYFPQIGIIGWDVLIDVNGSVRVIEVNLDSPGIVGEQFVSGTFFKDCRDEIISLFYNE